MQQQAVEPFSRNLTRMDKGLFLQLLDQLLMATSREADRPLPLRNTIRELQSEIEETGEIPADMLGRLAAAHKGITLGQEATTLLVNLQTLWQGLFGSVI